MGGRYSEGDLLAALATTTSLRARNFIFFKVNTRTAFISSNGACTDFETPANQPKQQALDYGFESRLRSSFAALASESFAHAARTRVSQAVAEDFAWVLCRTLSVRDRAQGVHCMKSRFGHGRDACPKQHMAETHSLLRGAGDLMSSCK